MEMVNAGHLMSLAALQRQDPYINKLLDVTGQVALYNFNSKTNEWEKTDIEGTLFVYERSASPHHGFTIMNRLSTNNLVEPINKDLEFQLQDPFLLYRNGNLGIYSIWFYDKRDCHRIAQLMVKIVKQEAGHSQEKIPERPETGRSNGAAEPRTCDILELLSKAKEEYQRTQAGEIDVSTETNVKTANSTAAEHAHRAPPHDKQSSHTMVKQITVEELFGSSLPKEPCLPINAGHSLHACNDLPSTYAQKQLFSASVHQNPHLIPHLTASDSASNQRHQAPALIPAPFTLNPSPVFQSAVPKPEPHSATSPMMSEHHISPPAGPPAFLGKEILGNLKPAVPTMTPDIHKPVLAPNFLPSSLVAPHSFQELKMDAFPQSPNLMKNMSTVPLSPGLAVPVLLSPSVFQQTHSKPTTAAPVLSAPPESLSAALPVPCSKKQLQDTLIHLIKNDPEFIGAIHDAYLQSLTKDLSTMKL